MNLSSDKKFEIGRIAVSLSLDAATGLYSRIGVPGSPQTASAIYKDLVARSGYPEYAAAIFPTFADSWNAATNEEERIVLRWTARAFGGSHPADTDLSSWILGLGQFQHGDWSYEKLSEEEFRHAQRFITYAVETIDRGGFDDVSEEVKSKYVLTEWDRRLHLTYGFNYFDSSAGADPFLVLKFVDQGERLRRAVRNYDFPLEFPHDKLRTAVQIRLEKIGVWMPDHYVVPPLKALLA